MNSEKQLIIGCVAENTSKYLSQALRLLQSIRWFGGKIASVKCIVCVVDGVDPKYRDAFKQYAAEVRIVERFSAAHPPSNKLRFLQQPDLQGYQNVMLLDCDTIVVQDPSANLLTKSFRAKIADGPTVSSEVFEKLFDYFRLPLPAKNQNCTVRGTPTIPYFNAGVLLFSQMAMNDLVPVWVKLNKQLIEHMELLEDRANFCEQASLSLALVATNTRFEIFGNDMNLPIQHKDYIASLENIDPLIIHYHSCFDADGYIDGSKYPLANARIDQFNQRLRQERQQSA
jgi:hypothetical protein